MKAIVYHGPEDLRVEEVPTPRSEPDGLVVRLLASSICGTDLRILHGNHRMYPEGTLRIPGHEVVGEVSEIGSEVRNIPIGRRVFIAPNIGCGHCRQCISGNNNRCADYQAIGITMDGGFAEYLRVPGEFIAAGNLIEVGRGLDSAVGALTEPFACVLRGQDRLAIRPGEVVLVMGAGPIGIMHAKLAKLSGASVVIVSEPNKRRAEKAVELGADLCVTP
ncbi:MAG TPA: alcohol dehydrogenase catalytic domain-containing protein, partial [Spirochaetia bacterium]|nr:alcohol dehydrogenase catalytic domain-containing protein [Spirochaetia bacterium]